MKLYSKLIVHEVDSARTKMRRKHVYLMNSGDLINFFAYEFIMGVVSIRFDSTVNEMRVLWSF